MITIKKHIYVFIFLAVLVCGLGVLLNSLLPERFFYDAIQIARDPYNEKGLVGSYPFTMWFYNITFLGKLSFEVIALIQLPILFFMIYKAGVPTNFHKFTLTNVVGYITLFLFSFFLNMPSKEFITMLYLFIIPFVFLSNNLTHLSKIGVACLAFLFFGVWFRPYFIMIPALACIMHLASLIRIKNKVLLIITTGIFTIIGISLSYGFVKGEFLTQSTREALNILRANSEDADSMILSPVKTDTWYGESIGIIYGFFTVNIPLNGLKFIFKPQVLAFILWQLTLFIVLISGFIRCLRNPIQYKTQLWMFFFVFSYFLIQGLFEPDLGSAVRHKMGIFPLLYYCLYYDFFKKKTS